MESMTAIAPLLQKDTLAEVVEIFELIEVRYKKSVPELLLTGLGETGGLGSAGGSVSTGGDGWGSSCPSCINHSQVEFQT